VFPVTNQTAKTNLALATNIHYTRKIFVTCNHPVLSMASFEEKEDLLSQKLQNLCDTKGKENSPQESATIFNELGLLYKTRSPDKISLIQSAALFNAAIVRQPTNQLYQENLQQLCKHVLQCAKALKPEMNLIRISQHIKEMVEEMRFNTNIALQKIKRIPESVTLEEVHKIEKEKTGNIKTLQNKIAEEYTFIMACVSEYCIKIMGRPPCAYALVGMGSLAREEITPYSDFEHIIVLEEFRKKLQRNREKILEYFRWYSVIFHIIIVNLQETIIPSVCISSLNDKSKPNGDWYFDDLTTKGIAFDGMMPHACKFPLGRTRATNYKPFTTELIKPVPEMARYLYTDVDLKAGYKLADILTKICHVAGSEYVYNIFLENLWYIKSAEQMSSGSIKIYVSQLNEDLDNFDVNKNLMTMSYTESWNIKRVLYRSTTLFVAALGRIFDSDSNSNFDIIADLLERGEITENTAHKLSQAVAIACYARLYQYMTKRSQDDHVDSYGFAGEYNMTIPEKLRRFSSISQQEWVNFFCTIYSLQLFLKNVAHDCNLNDYFERYAFINAMAIKIVLHLYNEVIIEGSAYLEKQQKYDTNDLKILQFVARAYLTKNDYSRALSMFQEIINNPKFVELSEHFQVQAYMYKSNTRISLNQYETVIKETNDILSSNQFEHKLGFHYLNGVANTLLKQHRKALISFRNVITGNPFHGSTVRFFENTYAQLLICVSVCLFHIGKPDQALRWLFQVLQIATTHDQQRVNMYNLVISYKIISSCYRVKGFETQANHYQNLQNEKISGKPWVSETENHVYLKLSFSNFR